MSPNDDIHMMSPNDDIAHMPSNGDKLAPIDGFFGRYRWLSNFWRCRVSYHGLTYDSSEKAYQAQKTKDHELRLRIRNAPSAFVAKAIGNELELRPDWDDIKPAVMRGVVMAKFMQNTDLLHKLLETGDAELIEGNNWGDTFWGVCRGEGENHLGKILMRVREDLALIW